jgi:hypothetical protein
MLLSNPLMVRQLAGDVSRSRLTHNERRLLADRNILRPLDDLDRLKDWVL